jgi:hypothetical protein
VKLYKQGTYHQMLCDAVEMRHLLVDESELLLLELCILTALRRLQEAEKRHVILPAPWAEPTPEVFDGVKDGVDLGKFRAEGDFAALDM